MVFQTLFIISTIVLFIASKFGDTNKSSNYVVKKCKGIKSMCGYNWYLRWTSAGMLKIAVFSYLQLYNYSFETTVEAISSSLAIFGTLYSLLFPFLLVILVCVNKNSLKSGEFQKKYGIYAPYKNDSLSAMSFPFFVCLRKVGFSAALVYF